MSFSQKARKIQSNSDKTFPLHGEGGRIGAGKFAAAIAAALHQDFGDTRGAIKKIVGLTKANERAVKNWFEGRNGPSGEFLILLCCHSDAVLETVLLLSGRSALIASKKFIDARQKLREMLNLLDEIECL